MDDERTTRTPNSGRPLSQITDNQPDTGRREDHNRLAEGELHLAEHAGFNETGTVPEFTRSLQARGYLLKGADPEQIRRAIHAAASGEILFGAHLAARMLGYFTASPAPPPVFRS